AGAQIPANAESALSPADNHELPARMTTQKKVDFVAGAEFGSAIDVRLQVLEFAAGLPHDDLRGEIAFVVVEDVEAGVRPDFAVFHARLGADVTHTRDGIRIVDEILEAETHQRRGLRDDGDQGEANQKEDPEETSAIHVAHGDTPLFIEFRALRKRMFPRGCCSG